MGPPVPDEDDGDAEGASPASPRSSTREVLEPVCESLEEGLDSRRDAVAGEGNA